MAQFTESGMPDLVIAPNGMTVPRTSLGPADTVAPAQGAAPALPSAVAPVSAAPLTAASVLAKRDAVLPPVLELAGRTDTTSVQKGIAPSVLNPILDANTARGDEQASAVTQAGDERAARKEQMAMSDSTNAYGRQQVAAGDMAMHQQNAQIAHQNELALALQKDPTIEPNRFVKNMSTGTSVSTVILAALNGAFKGMVGQQGNDVMDILHSRITQDLDAQKEQIQSGRVRRGNLISYFQNQGMKEDAAYKAAEATSWAMVDRMAASERERIGAGEDRTAANLLAEQLKTQTAQKNDELKLTLGQDRVATQHTSTMQQKAPTSANAGAEAFTKLMAARKAYEENGANAEEMKRFDSVNGVDIHGESETARGKREAVDSARLAGEKRSEQQSMASAAEAGIKGFATDAGLAIDPQTGAFKANGADGHTLNARQRERATLNPVARRPIQDAAEAAIEGFGRNQSGGVISDDEAVRFKAMISDATTDAQLADKLNAIMRIVRPRLAAQDRNASTPQAAPYPVVK